MGPIRLLAGICVAAVIAAVFAAPLSKKKKKEEITQALELPRDPPPGVVAETRRLVFHVSPLSSKGLLSQQTREAIRALLRLNGGAAVVKLRAFVAGSGDMRRVPAIVSEIFTEKHLALPAVTVVQCGGLPLEGAQVVIESISVAKRDVHPNGLLFVSGQAVSSDNPLDPIAPLAEKSLTSLQKAVSGTGANVERVTCFISSEDSVAKVAGMIGAQYPHASIDLVQTQRAPVHGVVECEAVAELQRPISDGIEFLNPEGLGRSQNYSQIVAVAAPRVALTGTQVAFGFQDSDARLAFQRLQKELAALGSSTKDVAMASIYPLSASIADQVRRVRFEFFDPAHPPASTLLPFEGLPPMDASFAVDVIAVVK
jgi:enamine deaminase RidA (YjgF/YER057c/UK114 family)